MGVEGGAPAPETSRRCQGRGRPEGREGLGADGSSETVHDPAPEVVGKVTRVLGAWLARRTRSSEMLGGGAAVSLQL